MAVRGQGEQPTAVHVAGPAAGGTMRAVVQDRYGSADVLRLATIARPEVADHEVLIRVQAAGLDRGVWHLMAGRPYLVRLAFGIRRRRNRVPGTDLAGTIITIGAGVTSWSVGDEVFGFGTGSFAEYAVAREDKLARKPKDLSFVQAAAVPTSAATALQALCDVGRVRPGQTVLVLGASGGVGSYAVQLAKSVGAEVTGVSSTSKLDLVRSLGADHVVDYTRQDFAGGAHRYDLIIDTGGSPALSRLRDALTSTGTAVIVGGEGGGRWTGLRRQLRAVAVSPFLRQRLAVFVTKRRTSDLQHLIELIGAGTVTPSVDRTFPLDRVPEAMRYLEAAKARGKVVITG